MKVIRPTTAPNILFEKPSTRKLSLTVIYSRPYCKLGMEEKLRNFLFGNLPIFFLLVNLFAVEDGELIRQDILGENQSGMKNIYNPDSADL